MENKYEIQWRVESLAQISMVQEVETTSCALHGISFSNWEGFDSHWRESNFWIAKGFVEAPSLNTAIGNFYAKLEKLIPRIALISQCYIAFHSQPFLVKRTDKESAYFRYVRDSESVGLLFGDQEKKALEILFKDGEISEAFYFYWIDAVNAIGYSSKLLLMCAALESVAKVGLSDEERVKDRKAYNRKFYQKIKKILGEDHELMEDLYGTSKDFNSGLRQRLVHGEYFSGVESEKDYVDLVHQRIIQYFNEAILKEELLSGSVRDPQRHIWGNKEGDEIFGGRFIRAIMEKPLNLKNVLSECDGNRTCELESYEYIYDGAITTDY
jgi:hypothetical protein